MPEEIGELFPLHDQTRYEYQLLNRFNGVGFNSNLPLEFRRRMVAGAVSAMLGRSGVDYTLNRQFKDWMPEDLSPKRIDRHISKLLQKILNRLVFAIQGSPTEPIDSDILGHFVSDATIVRLEHSFSRALDEANVGSLFECAAILRMCLEQFCWACQIRTIDDVDLITRLSTSRSITFAKSKYSPKFGQYYGLLSKYAHWEYDAHVYLFSQMKTPDITVASSDDKARAYLLCIAFVYLVYLAAPQLDYYSSSEAQEASDVVQSLQESHKQILEAFIGLDPQLRSFSEKLFFS